MCYVLFFLMHAAIFREWRPTEEELQQINKNSQHVQPGMFLGLRGLCNMVKMCYQIVFLNCSGKFLFYGLCVTSNTAISNFISLYRAFYTTLCYVHIFWPTNTTESCANFG